MTISALNVNVIVSSIISPIIDYMVAAKNENEDGDITDETFLLEMFFY